MKRPVLLTIIVFILLLFSLYFIWQIFPDLNLSISGDAIYQLIIVVLLTAFAYIVYLYAIKYIISVLGYDRGIKDIFLVISGSFSASINSPLKIGVPWRILLIKKILKIPYAFGLVITLLDNMIDFFIRAIIALIGILLIFARFEFVTVLIIPCLVAIAIPMLIYKTSWLEQVLSSRIFGKRGKRFIKYIDEIKDRIREIKFLDLVKITLLFFIRFVIGSIVLMILINIFGHSINLIEAFSIQSLTYLIGAISLIPFGLGAKDLSKIVILGLLGIPGGAAISVAVLARIISIGFTLVLGGASVIILGAKTLDKLDN